MHLPTTRNDVLFHQVGFPSYNRNRIHYMSRQQSAKAKTKAHVSFAVTAKLSSCFVFAKRIIQFLYFLNRKSPASIHLL